MSIIEAGITKALQPPVKIKRKTAKDIRLSAKHVTRGSTEVMLKITGFAKGGQHIKANLKYITRLDDEMENEKGQIFKTKEEVNGLAEDWAKDIGNFRRHKNQRDTMQMVLSMPESIDPVSVKNATREFAKNKFGDNHEYVFVLHTNEPHPHCHITVKCKGFNGKRLNPRKADLQEWREEFAETLRDQGVDAVASPRRSRGVSKKAENSVIRHIERGDKTHKPRVTKVQANKIREAVDEIVAEKNDVPLTEKPWEKAINKRRLEITNAWLSVADLLENKKTTITFDGKEAFNERPNYRKLRNEKDGQRAAALYQSNIKKYRQRTSPGTITSLRNVSDFNLVQHSRRTEMFLRSDAHNLLGWDRTTNNEMRREGNSNPRNITSDRGINHEGTYEENKNLASDIRKFVANMPKVTSERQEIKKALVNTFQKSIEKSSVKEIEREL